MAATSVRPTGLHLVATVTSPGEMPACVSPALRRRSELPFPYISAVSNQVMPPSSAALMMSSTWGWERREEFRNHARREESDAPETNGRYL